MFVNDMFSTRRKLMPPVGSPVDFVGGEIHTAELSKLAQSPDLHNHLQKDKLPIPATQDRERYHGERHYEYWLSGLYDYLQIKEVLPDFDFEHATILDFGGATGRVSRHFFCQEKCSRIVICDVRISNIDWVLRFFPKEFAAFKNSWLPVLPLPDESVDLVVGFSVFTHIDAEELAWLMELKRVLKPDGILYVTVHNNATWEVLPSTFVYQALMESKEFQQVYQPGTDLVERMAFRYSENNVYNCNTFHPDSYIREVWGRFFRQLHILPKHHTYQSSVIMTMDGTRSFVTRASVLRESANTGRGVVQQSARYLETATRYFNSQQYALAIPVLREALKIEPSNHDALWYLGLALVELGELEGAEQTFLQAITHHGKNARFYAQLGRVMRLRGDFVRAEEFYRQALTLAPEDMVCHAELALVLRAQDKIMDALPHFEAGVDYFYVNTEGQQQAAIENGVPAIFSSFLWKSGGTFLANTIHSLTGAPVTMYTAQLQYNYFFTYLIESGLRKFLRGGSFAHNHIPATEYNLDIMKRCGVKKIWIHLRDPRQVLVSSFFHTKGEGQGQGAVADQRREEAFKLVDYAVAHYGAKEGITTEWMIDNHYKTTLNWISDWLKASEEPWLEVFFTTFEEMVKDEVAFVARVFDYWGVPSHIAIKVQKDKPEDRFRKGKVDEWRSFLEQEHQEILTERMPKEFFARFGWEK